MNGLSSSEGISDIPEVATGSSSRTARDRAQVAAAVALALAARVAAMWLLRTWEFPAGNPAAPHYTFGFETGSIAYSLATGHGFGSPLLDRITGPTAWIAPVYPALVAAIFKILGIFGSASAKAALAMNSAFSAATCVPIYAVGRRSFGRGVALWSAWVWAACPLFWWWPITWVWDVSLSALLVTCGFWLALRLRDDSRARSWIWLGVFWGFCALTNPSLLVLAPVTALWAAWPQLGSVRGWVRTVVLAGVISVVVLSPWLVRNRMALGQWVFIRDNFPFELYLGNFPGSNGMGFGGHHPAENPAVMAEYQRLGELAFVDQYGERAKTYIAENPGEFARLCGVRFLAFWDGESILYHPAAGDWWRPWSFTTLSLMALFGGLFALARRIRGAWMYFLGAVLYPLAYYVTYPQTRYRHPVESILVLLSIYFVAVIVRGVFQYFSSSVPQREPILRY